MLVYGLILIRFILICISTRVESMPEIFMLYSLSGSTVEVNEYWRLFTSLFTDMSLMSCASSCLVLVMAGATLESLYGTKKFALAYFISLLSSVLFGTLINGFYIGEPIMYQVYDINYIDVSIISSMTCLIFYLVTMYKTGVSLIDIGKSLIFPLVCSFLPIFICDLPIMSLIYGGVTLVISTVIGIFLVKNLSVLGDLNAVSDVIGHKYSIFNGGQKNNVSDENLKELKKDKKFEK